MLQPAQGTTVATRNYLISYICPDASLLRRFEAHRDRKMRCPHRTILARTIGMAPTAQQNAQPLPHFHRNPTRISPESDG